MSRKKGIGTILVVEDDPIVRLAAIDTLKEAGASEIRDCSTTEDALAILREWKPDVVVLDVHLADRDDGWAIAELLSTIGPRPPKIIFSTGSPQDIPDDIAGLGTVLAKPVAPANLVAAVSGQARETLLSGLLRRPG